MSLLSHFESIASIPHPSGHLEAIRNYIIGMAMDQKLDYRVNAIGNVLVTVPPSKGRDSDTVTILQAHMDMVPQSDPQMSFDWHKDPLRLRTLAEGEDEEYPDVALLKASGTTLGADNGIGIAAMLEVMCDPDLPHGPVLLLFTVDEETGMSGVKQMEPGWVLQSLDEVQKTCLLNLDAEREGDLMVSCAGAVDLLATFRYKMDAEVPEGDVAVRLAVSGLKGGHSGMDVHLGRGNACKLMIRFLKHAVVNFEARVASICGGGVRNAIPRDAEAVITVPAEVVDELLEEVDYYDELYRYELRSSDNEVRFSAHVIGESGAEDYPQALLPEEVQDDILNSIEAAHDGVFRMSPDLPDVVETSCNLALVRTDGEGICRVLFMIRSLNEEMKRALASRLQSCFILGGAKVDFCAAYAGWETPLTSPLVARARRVYQQLFGREIHVNSVHCGLECGVLKEKNPALEIVAFGPTIHHPHSPQESVELASVERFWQFLCAMI